MIGAGYLLFDGGGTAPAPGPGPSGSRTSVPTTSPDLVAPARGPAPPSNGAWIGAWVKPDVPTQAGRIQAVSEFEKQLRRPLDIVHVYHSTEDFPAAADIQFVQQGKTLMISWSGDDTRVITSGRDDALIRQRAEEVKALGAPILLRWRWEMNRPNLQASMWSPADFVAAWKHVRAIFTEVGRHQRRLGVVPDRDRLRRHERGRLLPRRRPGRVDLRRRLPRPRLRQLRRRGREFMAWASTHAKPIIIGEFGAEDGGSAAQRADWIAGADSYAKTHPQIKALVYFEARRNENGNDRDFTPGRVRGPLAGLPQDGPGPVLRQATQNWLTP